jgi:hypothetical protein
MFLILEDLKKNLNKNSLCTMTLRVSNYKNNYIKIYYNHTFLNFSYMHITNIKQIHFLLNFQLKIEIILYF